MGLKIEPVSDEVLEAEFGTSGSGNDKETVNYILTLDVGKGFNVSVDGEETPRKVKRRINACAKEAFRELEWHDRAAGGFLARVKAINTEAEKKWEEERAKKAEAEGAARAAKEKSEKEAAEKEAASANGRQASREKAGATA